MAGPAQTFRVSVRGFKPLREMARQIADKGTMARLLEVTGKELQRTITREYLSGQKVRVVTGGYRASIEMQQFGARAVVVGTTEPRALFFEFARTRRSSRGAGRKGRKRPSRARATTKNRAHFKPALFQVRRRAPELWTNELKKIADRVRATSSTE